MNKFTFILTALLCAAALAQTDDEYRQLRAELELDEDTGFYTEPEARPNVTNPTPPPAAHQPDLLESGRNRLERQVTGDRETGGQKTSTSTSTLTSTSMPTSRSKQAVAVYMAGDEPRGAAGVHKILGGELARTISKSENYSAVDRTDAILRQLSREHHYQRSGEVSDDQIKALGAQFGVQYLCISEISAVQNRSYYLDLRFIDVETAEILRSVTTTSTLKNADEMMRIAQKLAYELVETERVKELLRQDERRREQTKKTFFYTAIGLDVLGAGLVAYGVYENRNVGKLVSDRKFPEAETAETRRNAAFIAGAALLATGITFHIFF